MSRETWEILQQMEPKDVELQLALQCAPLIAGLKPSNLFNIPCEGVCQVRGADPGYRNIHVCAFFNRQKSGCALIPQRKPEKIHGTGTSCGDAA